MRKATPVWFWLAIVLTLVASAVSIRARLSAESRNKATTLAMDYALLENASPAERSMAETLELAKQAGLGAVTISEQTVGEAAATGLLQLQASGTGTRITGSAETLARTRSALRRAGFATEPAANGAVATDLSGERLRNLSIGLPADAMDAASKAGLLIVARFSNSPATTEKSLRDTLGDAKQRGAWAYLPEGEQVLGQRDLVKKTAELLREQGWLYCSPEFSKIAGDSKLADLMQDRLIRLHSIQSSEVDKLSPAEFSERLVKAARERNIRILLVRPLSSAGAEPLAAVLDTLKSLRHSLSKEGVPLGVAHPFEDPAVARAVFVLIGFGIAFTGLYVLQNITSDPRWFVVGSLALVLTAALSLTSKQRDIPALLAAIVFPCAAYVWLEQNSSKLAPFLMYLVMSLIALTGGLAGAGLLNGLPFLVKVDSFTGVKAAHLVPIVFAGVLLVGRRLHWRELLDTPVKWGGLILGLGALMVAALMLMRTGNDNPAAVSGLELRLRSLMDWVFYTRPRTKEIFLGHPAMVLGLFALVESRRRKSVRAEWIAVALLIAGAIGQTSIVNTFSHLHTPLLLSLARVGIGWALGGAIGVALWFALRRFIFAGENPQAA